MHIIGVVETMMSHIREIVRSETVIGTPIRASGSVIVPVSRIRFGMGACGGGVGTKGKTGGTGAGGGGSVEPVACIVLTKDRARVLSIGSRDATVVNAAEQGSSLVVKVIRFVMKRRRGKKRKK